jgi:hypothetical protein
VEEVEKWKKWRPASPRIDIAHGLGGRDVAALERLLFERRTTMSIILTGLSRLPASGIRSANGDNARRLTLVVVRERQSLKSR